MAPGAGVVLKKGGGTRYDNNKGGGIGNAGSINTLHPRYAHKVSGVATPKMLSIVGVATPD